MPKQIKKRELKKGEKPAAVLSIITMFAGLAFATLFILLIPDIDSGSEDLQNIKALLASAGYVVFVALTAAAMVLSLIAYKKSKQSGDAARGFFSGISLFTALLSIRFMLALFAAGTENQEMLDGIVGSGSYAEFVKNQTASFACLVISLAVMLIVGISAMVKLGKR